MAPSMQAMEASAVSAFSSPKSVRPLSPLCLPMPAFHHDDTDDDDSSGSPSADTRSDDDSDDDEPLDPPTFHYEPDCSHALDNSEADSKPRHPAASLHITTTAASPSHSSAPSTPHALYLSPTAFFASPTFASLLSARAASLTQQSHSTCSDGLSPSWSRDSDSGSPHSSVAVCYTPRSSVRPSVFAWQLEEAAILFWERYTALGLSHDKQADRTARLASRHGTM